MTFRTTSQLGVGADIGNSSRWAMRGEPQIRIGQANKGINPLNDDGSYTIGRPTNMPDFKNTIDVEKIQSGYPKNHLYSIPIKEESELPFVIDHPKLLAFQMQRGKTAVQVRYATTGQTTVKAATTPTKYEIELTSATGIKVGDLVHVETIHSTLGGFNETAFVKSKSGSIITLEGLSNAPAVGAFVKKVAGKTTGTDVDDTGIYIPKTTIVEFEVYHAIFVVPLGGSDGELVISVPELEIRPENLLPNFNGNLATMSFTGMPRTQTEKAFLQTDGTTKMLPWTMEAWLIPAESA